LFEFTEDELLLVLKNTGSYYLIDPLNPSKKPRELDESFKKYRIINAQNFGNSVIVMRSVEE
jgi:hypothetical protein